MQTFKYSYKEMFYLRLFAKNKYKGEIFTNTLRIVIFMSVKDELIFRFYHKKTHKDLQMNFYIALSKQDATKIYLRMTVE